MWKFYRLTTPLKPCYEFSWAASQSKFFVSHVSVFFWKGIFQLLWEKLKHSQKNKFNPCQTFPEIFPVISCKSDKNPTFKRNIQNWKIKRQPVQKFSKQRYFLSLQSVWVFLHSAAFQYYEFHVVCINWGSFFIQWNKKFKSTSYKSQQRTGIFFNGESGPRSKAIDANNLTPLFQIQTISNHAKPRTIIWFQIQPLTVCFSSCDVWAFFQKLPISHRLVCRFLRQSRPNTWQSSSRQCWENGLCLKWQGHCG